MQPRATRFASIDVPGGPLLGTLLLFLGGHFGAVSRLWRSLSRAFEFGDALGERCDDPPVFPVGRVSLLELAAQVLNLVPHGSYGGTVLDRLATVLNRPCAVRPTVLAGRRTGATV